jgi:hypothetical protein
VKYFLLTFDENWADEHDVPALACFTEAEYEEWQFRAIEIHARLGNSGEYFEEEFEHCIIGRDYEKEGYVSVFEVDENFFNTFHKANLSGLSLCNIFDKG